MDKTFGEFWGRLLLANLNGQLFFKRLGFIATRIIEGHFEDTDESAIEMRYTEPKTAKNVTN